MSCEFLPGFRLMKSSVFWTFFMLAFCFSGFTADNLFLTASCGNSSFGFETLSRNLLRPSTLVDPSNALVFLFESSFGMERFEPNLARKTSSGTFRVGLDLLVKSYVIWTFELQFRFPGLGRAGLTIRQTRQSAWGLRRWRGPQSQKNDRKGAYNGKKWGKRGLRRSKWRE